MTKTLYWSVIFILLIVVVNCDKSQLKTQQRSFVHDYGFVDFDDPFDDYVFPTYDRVYRQFIPGPLIPPGGYDVFAATQHQFDQTGKNIQQIQQNIQNFQHTFPPFNPNSLPSFPFGNNVKNVYTTRPVQSIGFRPQSQPIVVNRPQGVTAPGPVTPIPGPKLTTPTTQRPIVQSTSPPRIIPRPDQREIISPISSSVESDPTTNFDIRFEEDKKLRKRRQTNPQDTFGINSAYNGALAVVNSGINTALNSAITELSSRFPDSPVANIPRPQTDFLQPLPLTPQVPQVPGGLFNQGYYPTQQIPGSLPSNQNINQGSINPVPPATSAAPAPPVSQILQRKPVPNNPSEDNKDQNFDVHVVEKEIDSNREKRQLFQRPPPNQQDPLGNLFQAIGGVANAAVNTGLNFIGQGLNRPGQRPFIPQTPPQPPPQRRPTPAPPVYEQNHGNHNHNRRPTPAPPIAEQGGQIRPIPPNPAPPSQGQIRPLPPTNPTNPQPTPSPPNPAPPKLPTPAPPGQNNGDMLDYDIDIRVDEIFGTGEKARKKRQIFRRPQQNPQDPLGLGNLVQAFGGVANAAINTGINILGQGLVRPGQRPFAPQPPPPPPPNYGNGYDNHQHHGHGGHNHNPDRRPPPQGGNNIGGNGRPIPPFGGNNIGGNGRPIPPFGGNNIGGNGRPIPPPPPTPAPPIGGQGGRPVQPIQPVPNNTPAPVTSTTVKDDNALDYDIDIRVQEDEQKPVRRKRQIFDNFLQSFGNAVNNGINQGLSLIGRRPSTPAPQIEEYNPQPLPTDILQTPAPPKGEAEFQTPAPPRGEIDFQTPSPPGDHIVFPKEGEYSTEIYLNLQELGKNNAYYTYENLGVERPRRKRQSSDFMFIDQGDDNIPFEQRVPMRKKPTKKRPGSQQSAGANTGSQTVTNEQGTFSNNAAGSQSSNIATDGSSGQLSSANTQQQGYQTAEGSGNKNDAQSQSANFDDKGNLALTQTNAGTISEKTKDKIKEQANAGTSAVLQTEHGSQSSNAQTNSETFMENGVTGSKASGQSQSLNIGNDGSASGSNSAANTQTFMGPDGSTGNLASSQSSNFNKGPGGQSSANTGAQSQTFTGPSGSSSSSSASSSSFSNGAGGNTGSGSSAGAQSGSFGSGSGASAGAFSMSFGNSPFGGFFPFRSGIDDDNATTVVPETETELPKSEDVVKERRRRDVDKITFIDDGIDSLSFEERYKLMAQANANAHSFSTSPLHGVQQNAVANSGSNTVTNAQGTISNNVAGSQSSNIAADGSAGQLSSANTQQQSTQTATGSQNKNQAQSQSANFDKQGNLALTQSNADTISVKEKDKIKEGANAGTSSVVQTEHGSLTSNAQSNSETYMENGVQGSKSSGQSQSLNIGKDGSVSGSNTAANTHTFTGPGGLTGSSSSSQSSSFNKGPVGHGGSQSGASSNTFSSPSGSGSSAQASSSSFGGGQGQSAASSGANALAFNFDKFNLAWGGKVPPVINIIPIQSFAVENEHGEKMVKNTVCCMYNKYQKGDALQNDPKLKALTIVCGVEEEIMKFVKYLKEKGEKKVLKILKF